MPELKQFLWSGDGAESYQNVGVEYIIGRKAVLTIYHYEQVLEEIDLSAYNTQDELHELFRGKGFLRKSQEELALQIAQESVELSHYEQIDLRELEAIGHHISAKLLVLEGQALQDFEENVEKLEHNLGIQRQVLDFLSESDERENIRRLQLQLRRHEIEEKKRLLIGVL